MVAAAKGVVEWEDPPETTRFGRSKFDVEMVLDDLTNHPGEWARIAEDISASYIGTSKLVQELRDKNCEVKAAKVDGIRVLYARHNPRQGRSRGAA